MVRTSGCFPPTLGPARRSRRGLRARYWFNAQKGFGSIQPADGSEDVVVHISAVERAGMQNLNEGRKICYEPVADRRSGKMSADNPKAD